MKEKTVLIILFSRLEAIREFTTLYYAMANKNLKYLAILFRVFGEYEQHVGFCTFNEKEQCKLRVWAGGAIE